jgi:hypothetical protein
VQIRIVGGVAAMEEGLICKVRGLKSMHNSCHCCALFHGERFGLVSHHLTLLSLALNCFVIWCCYHCYCVSLICCYFCFLLLFLVHTH